MLKVFAKTDNPKTRDAKLTSGCLHTNPRPRLEFRVRRVQAVSRPPQRVCRTAPVIPAAAPAPKPPAAPAAEAGSRNKEGYGETSFKALMGLYGFRFLRCRWMVRCRAERGFKVVSKIMCCSRRRTTQGERFLCADGLDGSLQT